MPRQFGPSVSFEEDDGHPARGPGASLDYDRSHNGIWLDRSATSDDEPLESRQEVSAPPDEGWSVAALQWERPVLAGARTTPDFSAPPFSRAGWTQVQGAPAAKWTAFRTLSWCPKDGKVRLRRSASTSARNRGGGYVFDQAPGGVSGNNHLPGGPGSRSGIRVLSPNFTGNRRDGGPARNHAVSASAVARMHGGDDSLMDDDNDDDAGRHRKTGGGGSSSKAAIQFTLRDLRAVHRHTFPTPTVLELTKDGGELSETQRIDQIACRFCLFGPVGVIVALSGGFDIYLVLADASDADLVYKFLQRAIAVNKGRDVPPLSSEEQQQPGTVVYESPRRQGKVRRSFSRGSKMAPKEATKNKSSSARLTTPDSSAVVGTPPRVAATPFRVAGSGVFDQSTQSGITTYSSHTPRLHMPAGKTLKIRPYAAAVQSWSATRAALDGDAEGGTPNVAAPPPAAKFSSFKVRPSRITRKYMRSVRVGAALEASLQGASSHIESPGKRGRVVATNTAAVLGRATPLNVHLTDSHRLWWQRMKHSVAGSWPVVTVNVRASQLVNLSSEGSSFKWRMGFTLKDAVQGESPLLSKSLAALMGPLERGPDVADPSYQVWYATCEAAVGSPALKEAWLGWFELMGAHVQWTAPLSITARFHPTSELPWRWPSPTPTRSPAASLFSPLERNSRPESVNAPPSNSALDTAPPSENSDRGWGGRMRQPDQWSDTAPALPLQEKSWAYRSAAGEALVVRAEESTHCRPLRYDCGGSGGGGSPDRSTVSSVRADAPTDDGSASTGVVSPLTPSPMKPSGPISPQLSALGRLGHSPTPSPRIPIMRGSSFKPSRETPTDDTAATGTATSQPASSVYVSTDLLPEYQGGRNTKAGDLAATASRTRTSESTPYDGDDDDVDTLAEESPIGGDRRTARSRTRAPVSTSSATPEPSPSPPSHSPPPHAFGSNVLEFLDHSPTQQAVSRSIAAQLFPTMINRRAASAVVAQDAHGSGDSYIMDSNTSDLATPQR